MKYYCVKQFDTTDCGAACLATICKQYGFFTSITKIREVAGTDKDGTNVYGMVKAANQLGFTAKGVKGNRDAFFSEIPLPSIAHVIVDEKLLHYVVIHKITKTYVVLADPARGVVKEKIEDFFKMWSGVLILMVPKNTFKKGDETQSIFKRFFHLILPHKKLVFDIFLASVGITVLGISGAFYFQLIIDDILPAGIIKTLHVVSIGIILLKLFSVALSFIRAQLLIYLSQKLDIALLLGYYDHVLKLPMNFFGTRKVGEIISRFQDASSIRNAISSATLTLMIDSIMVIAGGIILVIKSPLLFLIATCMIVLYAILVWIFNEPFKSANKKQMEDNAQLTSYLVESINGIQTVKTFSAEDSVATETEFRFVKLLRSIFKLQSMSNVQEGLKLLVELIGGTVILWVGTSLVLESRMTIGSLISFNALLVYFLNPVRNIIDLQKTVETAVVASDRLGEILDLEIEKGEEERKKIIPTSLIGDIEINDVSFRYGTRRLILENFSMKITAGERVAIVGESGAGKSTIAKLLLNLYQCEKGLITISDVAIADISIDSLRRKIAYVDQETFLFSASIMDNLTFGIDNPDYEEVIEVAKKAKVHEFVNELPLRYETVLSENGRNLSGGQRQRIAIARAMLKHPDILILDEPTSNLDAVTEKAIWDTITGYSEGITTIVIAHRLSTIKMCDRVFVMEKGRIVESGTHNELMQNEGYYRKLFMTQTE